MNYDHCNKVHEYWIEKIFPHLVHNYSASSFDSYLKAFSFLPSGKWIHDLEKIKFSRVAFAVDPEQLVSKYKKYCVTYNAPIRPEDGVQRVIYQVSPTLHFESAFWVWVEHDRVNAYASVFVCFNDEKEYLEVLKDLWQFKQQGNTEERTIPPGFLPFSEPIDIQSFTRKKEVLDKPKE